MDAHKTSPKAGYAITTGVQNPLGEVKKLLGSSKIKQVERLLVREKNMGDRDLLSQLKAIRLLLPNCLLMVSNRVDLALLAEFDGVQLASNAIPLSVLRAQAGSLQLFRSVHNRQEMQDALLEGADGLTLSPVFATPSKAGIMEPLGLENAVTLMDSVEKPVYLLGGMNDKSLPLLVNQGVSRFAAMSYFFPPGGES